jgi:hypothetical protein
MLKINEKLKPWFQSQKNEIRDIIQYQILANVFFQNTIAIGMS